MKSRELQRGPKITVLFDTLQMTQDQHNSISADPEITPVSTADDPRANGATHSGPPVRKVEDQLPESVGVTGVRFALLVRRETGMESRVKVSYGEGVAIRIGLESCAAHREVWSEALTEEVQASH